MSYPLEFPPGPLPPNALSSPYAVVGIWGTDVTHLLPPKIPLNLALHFMPKLQQWVLPAPAPSSLPWPLARRALRSTKIGIDILHDGAESEGLAWITSKILQLARIDYPKSLVLINTTLDTATSIYKTWLALDLPLAGVTILQQHCMSKLMLGPAVTLPQIQRFWNTFPHNCEVVREMGANFVRSYLDFMYMTSEFSQIQDWYLQSSERRVFFKKLLGKEGTSKSEVKESKEREIKDGVGLRTKIQKMRSDESMRSVETVVWNPLGEGEEESKAPKKFGTIRRNLGRQKLEAGRKM
jgi:hypothetical protein